MTRAALLVHAVCVNMMRESGGVAVRNESSS
jgi:hypothetical protein